MAFAVLNNLIWNYSECHNTFLHLLQYLFYVKSFTLHNDNIIKCWRVRQQMWKEMGSPVFLEVV